MRAAGLLVVAWALTGCAVVNFLPGEEPIYLVIRGGAPLWSYGPQQAGLPNERLDLGDTVRIVRWEYGFSRVKLESGMTGYMANEDLKKAPDGTTWRGGAESPVVPRPRGRVADEEGEGVKRKREVYRGPIVDDAPLPVAEPDLNESPADGPTLE